MGRKSNVNQVDRQIAVELRSKGLTYKEIVAEMENRVTIDWCKLNLKGIVNATPEATVKETVLSMALRPQGVTYYECCNVFVEQGLCYETINEEEDGERTMYDTYQKIKRSVKDKNSEAVFRPVWLDPNNAKACLQEMLQNADNLYNRFQGYVDDYMIAMFPDDYNNKEIRKSVEYELSALGIPFKIKESVIDRCDRNSVVVLKLQERN